MIMPHSSNGKHRRIAIEEPRDRSVPPQTENAGERIEAALTDMHEMVLAKSSAFIREHPGASLLLAATVGGFIGWLIKRRA
jgi:ElaB/YqjD/DUF883 family membrane-anchored ribosome-binding protein